MFLGNSLSASPRRSGTTHRACRNPVIRRRARFQPRKPDQAQSSSRPGEPKPARPFRTRAHRQRSARAINQAARSAAGQRGQPGRIGGVHRKHDCGRIPALQIYELNEVASLEGSNMSWHNRMRFEVARNNLMRMWTQS